MNFSFIAFISPAEVARAPFGFAVGEGWTEDKIGPGLGTT